ncbi:hypothetical protein ACJJTC_012172 [Scirpophaga incertulas]
MSFITKRERVFNDYDLIDLPSRNEGKLKAYASCTDARAWSHFCSDKTEHLVDIIKRNNDTCRPKYVPTDVIVQTLMVSKNAEIGKLRRKIEEFEQMLAAYDQLELTCAQKCEIANAHANIKAANKELDELCLDLDLSGFTEGADSEVFETGKSGGDEPTTSRCGCDESSKSRGDEWSVRETPRMESKSNQTSGLICCSDATTSAEDPRIDEMKEMIISKDAKLSAMQNTIAVMENDVCEPYCIYAQIYTSLEKIFAVLCQNEKYKLYLNLMTSGKDIRCIDITGKILFKLKVLEKFCLALISPCSEEISSSPRNCTCLRAEVTAPCECLQSSHKYEKPALDKKRALLIADIMENEELNEIISKDISIRESDEDGDADSYSIDTENFRRLKILQADYEDLMVCYEKIKHENKNLHLRCHKYEELEKEYENLRHQLLEYNNLWNEKEYFKNRSIDLDSLKDQFIVLANETSNLERKVKAEIEVNDIKSNVIDELRNENFALKKKINEAMIEFEKEKNAFQCKLKESECTIMCQEQQIKSLSVQIDKLLEQGHDKVQENDATNSIILINEIDTLKEHINNLKESLCTNEEEKNDLLGNYENSLKTVNELKLEFDVWKSSYEKATQRNTFLEKYTDSCRDEVNKLNEENEYFSQKLTENSNIIDNLESVLSKQNKEIKTLLIKIDQNDVEKNDLQKELQNIHEKYNQNVIAIEKSNAKALEKVHLARQESQDILDRIHGYNNSPHNSYVDLKNEDSYDGVVSNEKSYHRHSHESIIIQNSDSDLLDEIQDLRNINSLIKRSIDVLRDEKNTYKTCLELTKKESENMENRLLKYKNISEDMEALQDSFINFEKTKVNLEEQLSKRKSELNLISESMITTKQENQGLIAKLQAVEEELVKLKDMYNTLLLEKDELRKELLYKTKKLENMTSTLTERDEELLKTIQKVTSLEQNLNLIKSVSSDILSEKNVLKQDFDIQLRKLNNILESKTKENLILTEEITQLHDSHENDRNKIIALENEHKSALNILQSIQKESNILINKLNQFESLQTEYEKIKAENEMMQCKLNELTIYASAIEQEKLAIDSENQHLQSINESLEKSLIDSRHQLISQTATPNFAYDDVMTELEHMKEEKIKNQQKIQSLLHSLNESENIVVNLNKDLVNRNNKIAILENHINGLEDEIRSLQSELKNAIETGEQISVNSFEKLNYSLKTLETNHAKTRQNIEMELVKLQNEHAILEQKLEATIVLADETAHDKNKYLSQVIHLQHEIERLIVYIKDLEVRCVGSSSLLQLHYSIDNVLESLNRIGRSFDQKNSTLEHTINKVQTSSQLLLSKADEAKKIVEKEKQKIIMEKEEAIKEKINMENELKQLKKRLENEQFAHAENMRECEAKAMNQKLINQNIINNLKTELKNLHTQYEKSLEEINELKVKIEKTTSENYLCLNIRDQLKTEIQEKTKALDIIENELNAIKNKSIHELGIQTNLVLKNVSSQTDKSLNTYQGVNIINTGQ